MKNTKKCFCKKNVKTGTIKLAREGREEAMGGGEEDGWFPSLH